MRTTTPRGRPAGWRPGRGAIVAIALVMLATTVPVTPLPGGDRPAHAQQSDDSSQSRQITFQDDGSVGQVTVDKTADLRNEVVRVEWSGFKPTESRFGRPNLGDGASAARYPVAILQCYHAAGEQPAREHCMTNTPFNLNGINPSLDLNEEFPDPEPRSYAIPFADLDGQVHDLVDPDGPDGPLEASQPDDWHTFGPSAKLGLTTLDGTGSADFQIRTGDESPNSLGCGRRPEPGAPITQCSLVVIPIRDMECDPEANRVDLLACGTGSRGDTTRNYLATLSGSNWDRHRVVFPLSFAPEEGYCELTDVERLSTFGSELAADAMYNWIPALCSGADAVPVSYTPSPENTARNLYANGDEDFVLASRPMPDTVDRSTSYAPMSISGFGIAFMLDDAEDQQVTRMNLNARLVAKMLTQSYRGGFCTDGEPYLCDFLPGQPKSLLDDREFQELNPHIQLTPQLIDLISNPMATLALPSALGDIPDAVTSWIAADPEAVAFLSGEPDPWGTEINPVFRNWQLPVDGFESRDDWSIAGDDPKVPQPHDPDARRCGPANSICAYVGELLHSLLAQPNTSIREIGSRAVANSHPLQTVNYDAQYLHEGLKRSSPQSVGDRAVIGLVDLATAERYQLPLANLSTGGQNGDGDSVFTAPSQQQMFNAVRAGELDDSGVIEMDYDAITERGGYPGTMVSYAAVDTCDLNETAAEGYATTIEYAAGRGQIYGESQGWLPPGYLSLPPELAQHSLAVAGAVREQTCEEDIQPPIDDPDDLTPAGGDGSDIPLPEPIDNSGDPGDGPTDGAQPDSEDDAATDPTLNNQDQVQLASTEAEAVGWIRWVLPAVLVLGLAASLAASMAWVAGADPRHPVRQVLSWAFTPVRRAFASLPGLRRSAAR